MFKEGKAAYEGYCNKCDEFKKGSLKKRRVDVEVRGVALKVDIYELYCNECHELLTSEDVEKMNDVIIYDAYKSKMGLLTSDEIKSIRRKRHMSQGQMADFLDIGVKDITRYENGAIQTKCIDNMIRMMDDDKAFLTMCSTLNKMEYYRTEKVIWFKTFDFNASTIDKSFWMKPSIHIPFIFYNDSIEESERTEVIGGDENGREKVRAQA